MLENLRKGLNLQVYETECFKAPGVSPRTEKPVKWLIWTSVRDHMHFLGTADILGKISKHLGTSLTF